MPDESINLNAEIGWASVGQQETTAVRPDGACPWCSGPNSWTVHGGRCPQMKAIEYHPNGLIKRVEFLNPLTPAGSK